MSRRAKIRVFALLLSGFLVAGAEVARGDVPPLPESDGASYMMGVEVAQAFSEATGIAISPLFAVGALGAYRYAMAEPAQRPALPWFASMWVWGPALGLTLLLILKDPILGFAPVVKKPFDALEVVENTASGVLASAAVVPIVLAALSPEVAPATHASAGFGDQALSAFVTAAALAGFVVMWLAANAVNVLIFLSPFGPLDVVLRSIKAALLSLVVVSSAIHPYFGAFVSICILLLALRVAGWSFRLTVFGWVFAWDGLTLRHKECDAAEEPLVAFSTQLPGLPVRTLGRLERPDGAAVFFAYRPWLILPEQKMEVAGELGVGRGLLWPSLLARSGPDDSPRKAVSLPPRFRTHEDALCARLGGTYVQELGALKGIRAVVQWTKDTLRGFARSP